MSVIEPVMGVAWLYSTLTGNAPLMAITPGGVHRGAAPVGTTAPWIVVEYQAGSDSTTMNGVRVLTSSLFQVKAVGPASITQDVADVAAQADDLLFLEAVVTVTGGYIHKCYREQPLMYDETPAAGVKYTHIGGLYRLLVQQTL